MEQDARTLARYWAGVSRREAEKAQRELRKQELLSEFEMLTAASDMEAQARTQRNARTQHAHARARAPAIS